MAQAAIPLMIASAVVSAGGQMAAGMQNASMLKAQGREEQAQGVAERIQIRRAARAKMGQQVMRSAESGFTPGYGTALLDLEESLINRELDLMMSRRNANVRQAGLKARAGMAKTQAAFGAAASLLGGASNVAGHKSNLAAAEA